MFYSLLSDTFHGLNSLYYSSLNFDNRTVLWYSTLYEISVFQNKE